jgi:hypothetical protein
MGFGKKAVELKSVASSQQSNNTISSIGGKNAPFKAPAKLNTNKKAQEDDIEEYDSESEEEPNPKKGKFQGLSQKPSSLKPNNKPKKNKDDDEEDSENEDKFFNPNGSSRKQPPPPISKKPSQTK